jgi:hypothetical protein
MMDAMNATSWVDTGVYGLSARLGDDGMIATRTAGGVRHTQLTWLRDIAAMRTPEISPNGPWTPELARTVLRALGLSYTDHGATSAGN